MLNFLNTHFKGVPLINSTNEYIIYNNWKFTNKAIILHKYLITDKQLSFIIT